MPPKYSGGVFRVLCRCPRNQLDRAAVAVELRGTVAPALPAMEIHGT